MDSNMYNKLYDLIKEAADLGFDICDNYDRKLFVEWLLTRGVKVYNNY